MRVREREEKGKRKNVKGKWAGGEGYEEKLNKGGRKTKGRKRDER